MPDEWKRSDGRFTVRVSARKRKARVEYRVRYWFRGCPESAQTAREQASAVERAEAIWTAYQRGQIEAPAVVPATVEDALKEWLDRPALAERTRTSYRNACGLLLDQVGRDAELWRLTAGAVRAWLEGIEGDVTHNTYRRTVGAWVRWMVEQGWLPEDITARIRPREVRHVMRSWLPHDQWDDYLAACNEPHRIRSEFVLHTGLRAKELAAARWSWLRGDVGRRAISIPASVAKSKKARAVPLDDRALAVLEDAAEQWGRAGFIFSTDGLSARSNLPRDTRKAWERANVARANEGMGPLDETDFHGLRRAAGSRWLERGVEMHIVQLWLGHSSIDVTIRHYAGVADSTSMRYVELLNDPGEGVVDLRSRRGKGGSPKGE